MKTLFQVSLISFLFASSVAISVAQKNMEVVITEPARIELADLFKSADIVAVVHILSGDAESYDKAIYKAEVLRSFKGTKEKEILYFGPFIGSRLGNEYLVFLRTSKEPAVPEKASTAMYGTVQYSNVFNEGYSSMAASYECVFDEKRSKPCDYAIRVCTDYIVLPKNIRTFPAMETDTPFGCRFVHRKEFESLVDHIAATPTR